MDLIDFMLHDKTVVGEYEKIDAVNPYPSNHGMKHIYGFLDLIDRSKDAFELSARDVLIVKTCAILHDLGQTQGRKDHGVRSREFAEKYLPSKGVFSNEELKEIYEAIEFHDEYQDYSKVPSRNAWIVNVVDKLDFSRHRLEDNYLERFKYSAYADIERLDFYKTETGLKIVIRKIEDPKILTSELLFKYNLFAKGMNALRNFGWAYNFVPEVYLEDEKLDLDTIDTSVIFDK